MAGLVDKIKSLVKKNPSVIDKAGDAIDAKTGKKYEAQVDKAQDAAKKFVEGDK